LLGASTYLDEVDRCLEVATWSLESRESNGDVDLLELFFKDVSLVHEQDDGGINEPFIVTNLLEELQRLVHTIGGIILGKEEQTFSKLK